MLVEHIVVLQGACKGRDGHGGSLLLEKQLLSYLFSSSVEANEQMRALKSLKIDPLKIFGNTGGACVFLCLSVENCPDGKITAS